MPAKPTPKRRSFGAIRPLPSGRHQASYVDADGVRRVAPQTFDAKMDAEAWLADRYREVNAPEWAPKPEPPRCHFPQFRDFATQTLKSRDLAPRTRVLYESLLRVHILPTFGDVPLDKITRADVRAWYNSLDPTKRTARSNAYGLLASIFNDAMEDAELLDRNPCHVKGGGTKKRDRELHVLEPDDLDRIVAALPERYRALVLLSAYCALRFGEAAALRRSDLDLKAGKVHIRRALTAIPGTDKFEAQPKAGSKRTESIPPHVIPILKEHLRLHAGWGGDGLVFPPARQKEGGFLALSTLHQVWDRATTKTGRPDVRIHDLRHFGAIQYARAGATIGELQQRLGHKTATAALIYQSAISERDADIAARMSALAATK